MSSTAALMVTNGIAARHMSREQFGFWAILLSLNLLTNGFDLGFQFTLGNRLAALGSRGQDAEEERRETFLSIVFLQTAIFIVDSLFVLLAVPHLPWVRWFRISDPTLAGQVVHLMPIVLIIMIGTLPVGLIWTVFFAYHEIRLASFLTGGCNILGTAVFAVAAYTCQFTNVILIYFSFNVLVGLCLTAYVFIRRGWRFTFLPGGRMAAIVRSMARVSFHACFLTLSGIISGILGPILSGAVGGLAVAGDFTLVQKLFSFLVSTHLSLLAPVAPKVTLESHSGNWDAVRNRLRLCIFQVWPAFFLLAGGGVWFFHPLLIRLWAGHGIRNYPLSALLLAWACIGGFVNTFSVFLNSLGLVKMQAAVSLAMILPSIIIPVVLGRWLGVLGVALGMLLCSLPVMIIWPIYTRRALRLHLLRV